MGKSRIVRLVIALLAAIAAGVAAAVVAAVVLTIVDLYLSGHSLPTLSQRWVGEGWLHMSLANAWFRAATLASAVGTGTLVYRAMEPAASTPENPSE